VNTLASGRAPSASCPLCGAGCDVVFEVGGYPVQACRACGHRFVAVDASPQHVAAVYDDGYFTGGGAGYPDYLAEADLLRRHGQRYAQILRRHGVMPARMLDIGAAAGFVLRGFTDEGWEGVGVEPNPTMARHGRDALGIDIRTGALETVEVDGSFDLVGMIQVVAHFYDLDAAFERASALTRTGGHWLIETWNRDSLTARLLGRRWHEYSPPSVLRWFAPEDLALHLARFGLQEVARGRPSKRLNGAHAKSLLRYKLGDGLLSRALDVVPDRVEIPYPSEDLFWALYRKTL
jgi:SAM-dependent methyltransferase